MKAEGKTPALFSVMAMIIGYMGDKLRRIAIFIIGRYRGKYPYLEPRRITAKPGNHSKLKREEERWTKERKNKNSNHQDGLKCL
jgi:hypothetical protein